MRSTRVKYALHLKRISFLLLLSFCVLISSPSYADMSVRSYQQNIRDGSKVGMTEFYLEAIGTGITWTNSAYTSRNQQPIFCAPKRYKLTGDKAASIINSYLNNQGRSQVKTNDSISMVLLWALASKFPC